MQASFPFSDRYDWKNKTKLGEGAFGVVFKAKKLTSEQYVAIKQMDMSNFRDKVMIQALQTQINLMKNLKDQHLLRLQDSQVGNKYTYIVLELCDGDLRKKMNKSGGRVKEEEAIQIYSQILKGFRVLTDLGYIHRDIKPENTLYKGEVYKVADFGFSCKADMTCMKKLDLCCGTPLYMAPQLLKQQAYTAKSDIWSLGIMLFQLIFGYAPWPCRSLDSYLYNIMTKPLAFPYNGKIGEHTRDFIKKCLTVDEKNRIGWKELFEHPLVEERSTGRQVEPPKVEKSAVEIMKRIQESAARKNVDVRAILQQKNIDKMDERKFYEICRLIDPTISSFEARILFESLDTSKDKVVDFNQFKVLMLQSDFRDADDIASRYISELIAVAKRRNIQLNKLFKTYDKNNSGSIQKYEFVRMIRQLLPRMSDEAIDKIWQKFDNDKNGKIQLKEFIHEMTYGNADLNVSKEVNKEKATRCLIALKAAIKYYGVKLEEIMRIFDGNKDGRLNVKEFEELVTAIDKKLPQEELKLMFDYLDADKNGYVVARELRPILS